jgi:hypothetical protein
MTDSDYPVRELMDRALDGLALPTDDVTEVVLARAARKRRQRRGGALLGITAAVVAVAGIAATVPNPVGGPHGDPTVSAAAQPGATATKPSPEPSSSTAWMTDYVEKNLKSLLPAGSTTGKWSPTIGSPLQPFAPIVGLGGKWNAQGGTDLTTPGGTSSIGFSVNGFTEQVHCPSHAAAPYDDCTTTSLNGGTLTVDKSFKNFVTGTGVSIWNAYWNGPEGQSVSFSETADTPTHQALTSKQATALVMAPAWEQVWKSLPAPCPFGVMPDPHQKKTQPNETVVLVCATSRTAALHISAPPSATTG